MKLNELLEILEIDEPIEFEYVENFAEIVENDEEIDEEPLAELFAEADRETVAGLITSYFHDTLDVLGDDNEDIYELVDTIKHVLRALIQDEDEQSIYRFAEELHNFQVWFSFESAVVCTQVGGEQERTLNMRDALTLKRLEKLENEEYTYDFSACFDYDLDDYLLDMAQLSRERGDEDESEDFIENGYVYDDELE